MKFDCAIYKLDVDKIMKEVERCVEDSIRFDPKYVIMNERTFDELWDEVCKKACQYGNQFSFETTVSQCGRNSTIYGLPIALCEKLEFGEIEVV